MSRLMIGETPIRERAERVPVGAKTMLELVALFAENPDGSQAIAEINLKIKAGEIVGIAGVSGNGQSALVEALSGQRTLSDGRIFVRDQPFEPSRANYHRYKVFGLPEEPLRNAAAPQMSVAENIAFRSFDRPPLARFGWWLSPGPMRAKAQELIERYRVKTSSPDAPIATLSGGNVQRAILARELSSEVDVLIVANPCFGLDFASVADIRAQILDARNRGAAVLLVSEDLDEILELSDRVAVMSGGRIVHVADIAKADRNTIGKHMAGQHMAGQHMAGQQVGGHTA
jgi:general nucleoside transport system ATP-binding protein